jgi:hypothetical protein
MRQNNGPDGSRETFFSVTGVTSNFCAWAAVETSNPAIAVTHTMSERRETGGGRII